MSVGMCNAGLGGTVVIVGRARRCSMDVWQGLGGAVGMFRAGGGGTVRDL